MATLMMDLPEAPRPLATSRLAADCPRCGAPLGLRQHHQPGALCTGCNASPGCACAAPHDSRVQTLRTAVVQTVQTLATQVTQAQIAAQRQVAHAQAETQRQRTQRSGVGCRSGNPTYCRPAADKKRSNSAPSCCQWGGPHHARLRLRVAPVPLRALDSDRCVAACEVSAPEECRSFVSPEECGVAKGGARPVLLGYCRLMQEGKGFHQVTF